jgi:hypothetical protein
MVLTTIPFFATVAAGAAVPFIAAARVWRRRIGAARNASNHCANCGTSWSKDEHGAVDAWLVEAQLVCSECAPKMRGRTVIAIAAFSLAAGVSLYFGWGPIVQTISRYGFVDGLVSLSRWAWLMFALPPAITLCSADWAVRAMKKDNVRALDSLARIRLLTPSRPDPIGKLGLISDRAEIR